jgi:hypothetical protein
VHVVCASSAPAAGIVNSVVKVGQVWTITIHSSASVICGGGGAQGGLTVGAWLLIILLIVSVVYLVGGVLFNKFSRHSA